MNKRQESKLSMYLAVRDFLLQNSGTTQGLPNFEGNFRDLQETIVKIQNIAEVQKSDIKGFAKEKQQLRNKLMNLVLDNSYRLNAYASFKGDVKLSSAAKMTRSKLNNAPDTGVRDYAQIIFDMAESMVDKLSDYGINKESQTVMIDSINRYNEALSGPRVAKTGNVQSTKQLNSLFENADLLLDAISIAVGIIRFAQPLFYKGFETVRKIVVSGGSSYALKGMAVDSKSGFALPGTKFRISPLEYTMTAGEPKQEITRTSRGKGTFVIKTMPQGIYSVNVTRPGYKDKVVSIVINNGELTEMKVELEAA